MGSRSGFTLIELMITIAIMGLFASIVLVAINPAARIQQTYDAQHKNDLGQIHTALNAYATAHGGKYPTTSDVRQCNDCGPDDPNGTTFTSLNWIPGLVQGSYLKSLPTDPNSGSNRSNCESGSSAGYIYVSNGDDFKLMAYCTVATGLQVDQVSQNADASSYCPTVGDYDGPVVTSGNPTLPSMVDPKRPLTALAVYSEGFACR